MEFYIRTQKVALRPNTLKVNIKIWNLENKEESPEVGFIDSACKTVKYKLD
jgi:hypothetical protein